MRQFNWVNRQHRHCDRWQIFATWTGHLLYDGCLFTTKAAAASAMEVAKYLHWLNASAMSQCRSQEVLR